MALVYHTTVKTARMQATADMMDGGKIKIYTTGLATLLAVFTLPTPAETSVVGDLLTLDMDPKLTTTGAGDGVAAEAVITNAGETVDLITGLTVGVQSSGESIELVNTNIATSQPVELLSGTIQHAA